MLISIHHQALTKKDKDQANSWNLMSLSNQTKLDHLLLRQTMLLYKTNTEHFPEEVMPKSKPQSKEKEVVKIKIWNESFDLIQLLISYLFHILSDYFDTFY